MKRWRVIVDLWFSVFFLTTLTIVLFRCLFILPPDTWLTAITVTGLFLNGMSFRSEYRRYRIFRHIERTSGQRVKKIEGMI